MGIMEWIEHPVSERWPIMVKEYHTPVGTLREEVYQDEEWRWGDHVPFLDDFLETRSKKFIITKPEDLRPLEYLLIPPTEFEIAAFEEASQPFIEFAHKNGATEILELNIEKIEPCDADTYHETGEC